MRSKRAGDYPSVWDFLSYYVTRWRSARALRRARQRGPVAHG
ncbi:hypothetical protein [Pseudonocardia acaciae]|nr:hypothetical protein [Pseudonocardia acaciae]